MKLRFDPEEGERRGLNSRLAGDVTNITKTSSNESKLHQMGQQWKGMSSWWAMDQ